jgi:hypothetical protein
LERVAGPLDVDRRQVCLVDAVAGELAVVPGQLALAQRVVLGVALVRAGRLAQEPRRVAAVPVAAGLEEVAADVARWVMRTDRPRVAVLVDLAGVDAVAQAAKLQHDHG